LVFIFKITGVKKESFAFVILYLTGIYIEGKKRKKYFGEGRINE